MVEEKIPVDQRNLVALLSSDQESLERFRLQCLCPLDGKYGKKVDPVRKYLSAEAEWRGCAFLQRVLLETRVEFGLAQPWHLVEVDAALEKFDPLNVSLLEDDPKVLHDQLAVIGEIGRHVRPETKALLHPGTTSYDILDTIRSYLYKKAWREEIRPAVARTISDLCSIAERSIGILQVGRTHLQNTSPVLFGGMIAGYAARLAGRLELCDSYFNDLRGKVSGIVGTGASIEMVIGEGKSIEFEEKVLEKLGLKSDYTATQIVQKERLADVGHGLVTLMAVLGDFSEDVRKMYSSAIGEVTSRDNAERLGGSSADAMKNNPIAYENMSGADESVRSGIGILYSLIQTDFQRDLRGSVEERWQPRLMMAQAYESFARLGKSLKQFSINEDRLAVNLEPVRNNPSEAMTAILRGVGYVDPVYGVGHDFVKAMGKKAKERSTPLLQVCLQESDHFTRTFKSLGDEKQRILRGELELYTGSARERAQMNIVYARTICLV